MEPLNPDYLLVMALPDLPAGALFRYSSIGKYTMGAGYYYDLPGGEGHFYKADVVKNSYFFAKKTASRFDALPADVQRKLNIAEYNILKEYDDRKCSSPAQAPLISPPTTSSPAAQPLTSLVTPRPSIFGATKTAYA